MVRHLYSGQIDQGNHSIMWNSKDNYGKPVSAGLYFPCCSLWVENEISIGSCNGTFELDEILEETYSKMKSLLVEFGKKIDEEPRLKTKKIFYDKIKHIWIIPSNKHFSKTNQILNENNMKSIEW